MMSIYTRSFKLKKKKGGGCIIHRQFIRCLILYSIPFQFQNIQIKRRDMYSLGRLYLSLNSIRTWRKPKYLRPPMRQCHVNTILLFTFVTISFLNQKFTVMTILFLCLEFIVVMILLVFRIYHYDDVTLVLRIYHPNDFTLLHYQK